MMTNSTFLYEKNGFRVSKLVVLGYTWFVAEKPDRKTVKRHIRKSLQNLERMISAG